MRLKKRLGRVLRIYQIIVGRKDRLDLVLRRRTEVDQRQAPLDLPAAKMHQNLLDHRLVLDEGDYPHRPGAA